MDKSLICDAGRGDITSFRNISELYGDYVYSLCFCLYENNEKALDHCLSIFRRAYNAISLVDSDSTDLKHWLTSLVIQDYEETFPHINKNKPEATDFLYMHMAYFLVYRANYTEDDLKLLFNHRAVNFAELRGYEKSMNVCMHQCEVPGDLSSRISSMIQYDLQRDSVTNLLRRFRFTAIAIVLILLIFAFVRCSGARDYNRTSVERVEQTSVTESVHTSAIPDTAFIAP